MRTMTLLTPVNGVQEPGSVCEGEFALRPKLKGQKPFVTLKTTVISSLTNLSKHAKKREVQCRWLAMAMSADYSAKP